MLFDKVNMGNILYKVYFKLFHYKEIFRVKCTHFHIAALYNKQSCIHSSVYFDKSFSIKIEYNQAILRINENVLFKQNCSVNIFENGKLTIEENVFFNAGCSIVSLNNIHIGRNTIIGENVKMYDHNHAYKDLDKLIREQGFTTAPIYIEEDCWIGSNVVILKGVRIGRHSVIGANCIINKDIPAY